MTLVRAALDLGTVSDSLLASPRTTMKLKIRRSNRKRAKKVGRAGAW